jgi:hypothetical protein
VNEFNSNVVHQCVAIPVNRHSIVPGVDPLGENTDAAFPVKLGELIQAYDNAVQQLRKPAGRD